MYANCKKHIFLLPIYKYNLGIKNEKSRYIRVFTFKRSDEKKKHFKRNTSDIHSRPVAAVLVGSRVRWIIN